MVSAGGSDTDNIVSTARQRLSSKNITLDFVSVTDSRPLANLPSSGRPSSGQVSQQRPSSAQTGGAQTRATGQAGGSPSGGAQTTQQGTTRTGGTQTTTQGAGQAGGSQATQGAGQTGGTTAQSAGQAGGTQTTTPPPASTQDTLAATGTDKTGTAPSDGKQATDQNYDLERDTSAGKAPFRSKKDFSSFNPPVLLIIGITALLLLVLLIFFVSRRLRSSPNRVMASVSALAPEKEDRFADHSKDLASYAAAQSKKRVTPYANRPLKEQIVLQPAINPSGPLLLNLFVEDQNTSIGKRNIHSLKSGYSLTVGGGKSDDFMIFLVPVPSRMGEIRRNGSQLTFIPRKPKYFPDIGSNEVRDCINKRIRIVSDKNYEMWFSFVMYEDPLIALNRVLHSIKVPG